MLERFARFSLAISEINRCWHKLGELCCKDKADVSRMVSIMERKGLVQRESNAGNMYRALLKLTDEGKAAASQATPTAFAQQFEQVNMAGGEAVVITLSSQLSGTYQSAMIAAEPFGDKVVVVDSQNVTIGEQLLVLRAVQLRNEGWSAWEIAEILNRNPNTVYTHLNRGKALLREALGGVVDG